jgi:hypothetical protein
METVYRRLAFYIHVISFVIDTRATLHTSNMAEAELGIRAGLLINLSLLFLLFRLKKKSSVALHQHRACGVNGVFKIWLEGEGWCNGQVIYDERGGALQKTNLNSDLAV